MGNQGEEFARNIQEALRAFRKAGVDPLNPGEKGTHIYSRISGQENIQEEQKAEEEEEQPVVHIPQTIEISSIESIQGRVEICPVNLVTFVGYSPAQIKLVRQAPSTPQLDALDTKLK